MTVNVLAISGSLRAGSANTAALRTAVESAPADVDITIHDLRPIPFYDGDVEAAGMPGPVADLRAALTGADALLIATPEYNWSVPAVLKNAIDWASRAPDSPLEHLPTAMISAAGGGGGHRVQAHMRDVLAHNAVDVLDQTVQIPRGRTHVEDGTVVTPEHAEAIAALVVALRDHVREREVALVQQGSGSDRST